MAQEKSNIENLVVVRAAPMVGGTCCDCGTYDPNAAPLGSGDELYCRDCVDGAYQLNVDLSVEHIAKRPGRKGGC